MLKNIAVASIGAMVALSAATPALAAKTNPAPKKPAVTAKMKTNANGAAAGKPAMKAGKNEGQGKKTGFKPKPVQKKKK